MKLGEKILYINQNQVANLNISMKETLSLLDTLFREKGLGYTILPPKPGIMVAAADMVNVMPSWFKRLNILGMKWIGNYTINPSLNLPTIYSTFILNDAETGIPIAIMDGNWISGTRTGAVSGLTTKYLANPDSQVLSIIGLGVQARTNLRAIAAAELEDLKKIYIFDLFPAQVERYLAEMESMYPQYEFIVAKTPEEAVRNADILVTAMPFIDEYRKADGGIVEKGWLKKGCLICDLDVNQYFKQEVLDNDIDLFTTDDITQFNSISERFFEKFFPVQPIELASIILGYHEGRKNHDQIIFAENIGLGLCDSILGNLVYQRAIEKNIGTFLDL